MSDPTAEDRLREIERLLDERVGRAGLEDLTVVERIVDVIAAYDFWSELAIKRLHEIHRLSGQPCDACARYLDEP